MTDTFVLGSTCPDIRKLLWGVILFLTSPSDFQGRCFGNRLGVFGSLATVEYE